MDKKYPIQIKQFGEKIKELRTSASLTQADLAAKSGITRRSIQRVESGEFAAGLHIIFALAQALEITPSELLVDVKFGRRKK